MKKMFISSLKLLLIVNIFYFVIYGGFSLVFFLGSVFGDTINLIIYHKPGK